MLGAVGVAHGASGPIAPENAIAAQLRNALVSNWDGPWGAALPGRLTGALKRGRSAVVRPRFPGNEGARAEDYDARRSATRPGSGRRFRIAGWM